MKITIGIALALLVTLYISCERLTQPRLGGEAFTLQEAATLVTESYLRLHTGQVVSGSTLRVYRNGEMLWQKPYTEADSIVYDSTLAPAHTYTYRAELWSGSRQLARSNAVTVTTLDTTSHDFEWEIIEFPSPYATGGLIDVAIIDENNIWAVGEIYSDSNQPWLPYNAVHWDGEKWELKRVPYYDETGYAWYTPLHSILAFSENDIWFEAGIHWNGSSYISKKINIDFPTYINKMAGLKNDDFFIIGNEGRVGHYDGSKWEKVEVETRLNLYDIAVVDARGTVAIIGSNTIADYPPKNVLFTVRGNRVIRYIPIGIDEYFGSIWISPEGVWFISDKRLYRGIATEGLKWKKFPIPKRHSLTEIRGNSYNDFFTVGSMGEIMHFNGMNWKRFGNEFYGSWVSLDVKDNLAVAVGFTLSSGKIIILKRK